MRLAPERLLVGRYIASMSIDRWVPTGSRSLGVARRDGYHTGVAGIAAVILRGGATADLVRAHATADEFLMEALWRHRCRLASSRHIAAVALTSVGLSWLCKPGMEAWLERGSFRLRLEGRCVNVPLQTGDRVSLGALPADENDVKDLRDEVRFVLTVAERLLGRRPVRAW